MGFELMFASSNVFKVKDVIAFEEWASELGIEVEQCGEGYVTIYCNDALWPTEREDEDGESEDIDIADELKDHLDGNTVAVLTEFYIDKGGSAWGIAINAKGETRTVSFPHDLEKLAGRLGEFRQ